MTKAAAIGVLGATSFVGACLLPQLRQNGYSVAAFSRRPRNSAEPDVEWRQLEPRTATIPLNPAAIPNWVCVAPLWALLDQLPLLEAYGVQRLVALSSTSRFTKDTSNDLEEQALARRLADAEQRIQAWAQHRGVAWTILRPTLIYGLQQDKNITEIARFIRRFGFFPVFGKANGLRQPIHAADVAGACVAALRSPEAANHAYNISGGETLAYRSMVARVFTALGRRPRLLTVPLWMFRLAVAVLRCFPRYRNWSAAMAERMNRNLVFDHAEAVRDLGFAPRAFKLTANDCAP